MEYNIGDRVDLSSWVKALSVPPFGHMYEGVGPMATIINVGPTVMAPIHSFSVRFDNYEYVDEVNEDGEIEEDYHIMGDKAIKAYLAVKMFEYEPSQEGDKADDI